MLRVSNRLLLALLALVLTAPALFAVIKALTPLRAFMKDGQYIVVAKIDKLYADKPAMVLTVEEDLKGKIPFRTLPVLLKGDAEAVKDNHVPQLLKRLAADLPLVLFVNQSDKKLTAFAYTNGTWMQLVGEKTGPDTAVLSLTHAEPYLRRTFKGTTQELKQVLVDSLAGKKRPPEVNAKEEPGFGPEIKGVEE